MNAMNNGRPIHGPTSFAAPELVARLRASLATGLAEPGVQLVHGRAVSVFASPELDNALHLAAGMSFLPRGGVTPEHAHVAEELAIVTAGAGSVEIGDDVIPVGVGSVVLVPGNAPHRTRASDEEELAVLWVYTPPGSELRWLEPTSEQPY